MQSRRAPVVLLSDALRVSPREGAQVLATEIGRHCARIHDGVAIGPAGEQGGSFLPLMRGRWLGLGALRELVARRGALVVYLPQNGLTMATLLRAVLVTVVARPRRLDIVVLQQTARLPGFLRPMAPRWQFVVATLEQERLARSAGISVSRLYPRVPTEKVSDAPSRSDARVGLGWGDGPQYLHVGHARRGRNLRALGDLSNVGTLRLVISDYKPEEPNALPVEGAGVEVHRGPCADLADRYRAADVYVFPTVDMREVIGLPMSVFEALANATPVVARRSPALERWGDLSGLFLVDSDQELVELATKLALQGQASAVLSVASVDACRGDLSSCGTA